MAAWLLASPLAHAGGMTLPPEATDGLRLIYNGDPDAAIPLFRKLQAANPDDPLGYLLEAEALWWKAYCDALEIRWNMIDAWRRPKRGEDAGYFALTDRAISLADARIRAADSGEMQLYAGIGHALKARLYAFRDEKRAAARAGVKAREHFLRALALDPSLADANTGLGLYNYYVDTLSTLARVLRFFMGIPGGSKAEGIRQLEMAMVKGEMTRVEARVYLAKNLRNYDRQYERAAALLEPLVAEYPQNAVFRLLLGNMYAKLARNDQAAAQFRAAEALAANGKVSDPACAARVREISHASLAALKQP